MLIVVDDGEESPMTAIDLRCVELLETADPTLLGIRKEKPDDETIDEESVSYTFPNWCS